LTEFNPATLETTDSVNVGRSTEQMIVYGDYLLVNCWSFGNEVVKIDTRTNQLVGSVNVNKQPNSMILDKNSKLWVLSDGGYEGSLIGVDFPALAQIDPEKLEIIKTFLFPTTSGSPNNLNCNGSKDSLFFLYGSWAGETGFESGIYNLAIEDTQLPDYPIVNEGSKHFYRMGIDPGTSIIYVGDAMDYLQKGFIYRYQPDGTQIDSLMADRIPGYICFK
jgi:hypothetical protein